MISDWGDLQTILAIATEGSLSGAARLLGVNQSTTSRRLQAIETAMNRQLFLRTPEGRLTATATGQTLVETARKVQAAIAEVNTGLAESIAPIRIATCEILSNEFAAPMIAGWVEETGMSGDIAVHDDLFVVPDSEFEVMITPLDSAPEEMTGRRIGSVEWRLYATAAYLSQNPVQDALASLAGHKVIGASGPLENVGAFLWLAKQGGTPVLSSSSVFSQRDFALAGRAIALLPARIAAQAPALVELPYVGELPVSEVWMVARKAVAEQPRVRAFLDWTKRKERLATQSSPARQNPV